MLETLKTPFFKFNSGTKNENFIPAFPAHVPSQLIDAKIGSCDCV